VCSLVTHSLDSQTSTHSISFHFIPLCHLSHQIRLVTLHYTVHHTFSKHPANFLLCSFHSFCRTKFSLSHFTTPFITLAQGTLHIFFCSIDPFVLQYFCALLFLSFHDFLYLCAILVFYCARTNHIHDYFDINDNICTTYM
jgi:hypothetical protein